MFLIGPDLGAKLCFQLSDGMKVIGVGIERLARVVDGLGLALPGSLVHKQIIQAPCQFIRNFSARQTWLHVAIHLSCVVHCLCRRGRVALLGMTPLCGPMVPIQPALAVSLSQRCAKRSVLAMRRASTPGKSPRDGAAARPKLGG